jgi:hypothetical protein
MPGPLRRPVGPPTATAILVALQLVGEGVGQGPPAPLQFCQECVADFSEGQDAGAYKDVPGGPYQCNKPESPCYNPAIGTEQGGPAHQQACCALCHAHAGEGCVGYVISTGIKGGSGNEDPGAMCWLKKELSPVDPAPNRANAKITVGFVNCPGAWGATFLVTLAVAVGLYVGGGVALGSRGGEKPSLAAHPHYLGFANAAGLVADGAAFARARVQGRTPAQRRRGYGAAPESASHGKHEKKEREKEKETDKRKEKRKSSPVKHSKSSSTMEEGLSNSVGEPLLAAVSLPSPAPSGAAKVSKAAGDGGRWVHVPN